MLVTCTLDCLAHACEHGGAIDAPWRLARIAHELWGTPAPQIPRGPALADAVEHHYHDILDFYGAELGLRIARKHLGWYAEAARAPLRAEMLRADRPTRMPTRDDASHGFFPLLLQPFELENFGHRRLRNVPA